MADNLTAAQIAAGATLATKDLGTAHVPKNALVDQAGADAMGLVTGTPAANSLLGRLKAIADTLGTITFFPTIQPVSAASLPLPTGAATAAKQDALLASTAPTGAAFAITPHPTNPLERQISGLAIKTGGTIVYRYPGEGSDRTVDLSAGFYPFTATYIRATSTASGLTGF